MALSHLCPMESVHRSTWTLLERAGEGQEDPLMGPERNGLWNGKDTAHCLPPATLLGGPGCQTRVTRRVMAGSSPQGHGHTAPPPLRTACEQPGWGTPGNSDGSNSPAGLGATLAYGTSMNHLATLWKKLLHSYQQSAKVPGTLYSPTGMGSNLLFGVSASLIAKNGFWLFLIMNIFFCELAVLTLYSFF